MIGFIHNIVVVVYYYVIPDVIIVVYVVVNIVTQNMRLLGHSI